MRAILPLLLALAAGPARAALPGISSATLSDPYQLVGATVAYDCVDMNLNRFPERLVFDVSWGLLSVGHATLGVERVVRFAATPAYHIVSEAVSNGFCDTFYKVRDLNESWVDAKTMTSLGYSKKLREGKFFRDEWVVYDKPEKRFLSKTTNRDRSFSYASGAIPSSVQDVLSSVFYVRTGSSPTPRSSWTSAPSRPGLCWARDPQGGSDPAGTFDTVLVNPPCARKASSSKGKGCRSGSRTTLKTPVLMKVEVFFGHVTAKLSKML